MVGDEKMSSSDLIKQLRVRLEVDTEDAPNNFNFLSGIGFEHNRLKPIHESLLKVVEATERLMETGDSRYEYVDSNGSPSQGDYMLDALAALREIVGKHE